MELNINYDEFNQELHGLSFELGDNNSQLRQDIQTEVLNVVEVVERPVHSTILDNVRGDQSNVSTTTTTTTTMKKKKWKFQTQFSRLVSSIFPTSTRIDWKNKQYDCPEFEKNSPTKSAENLDSHVFKVKKHGTEAKRYELPKTTKDVQNHANLKKIFLDLLDTKWFVIKLEPKSTSTSARGYVPIQDGAGVYALFGKSKEKGCYIEKFGMSNKSVGYRLANQTKNFLFAALVMNAEQVDRFIPDRFVDAIIALLLPYYNFHPDHNDYMRMNIKLQLTEMLFGIIYKNNSRPYGENLVAVPSDKVRELSKVVSFTKEQIDVFDNKITEGDGMLSVTSWPPLRHYMCQLRDRQPNSTFLRHKLWEERPGDVTLGISEMLYENYYVGNEDIYKECPRATEVKMVINKIRVPLIIIQFMEKNESYNKEDLIALQSVVKDSLDLLRGDNYSNYVRPTKKRQAKSAESTFPVIFSNATEKMCFNTERYCMEGIHETNKNRLINWKERKQLIPDSLDALSVTTTKRQQPIMISSSDYISFADSIPMNIRLMNAGYLSTKIDYYVRTHNIISQRGDTIRDRLLTYMMAVDNNSFRKGRILFFPKGYFPSAPKNVMKVSKPLGIGYQEMLLIRHILGPILTFHLLRCHGLLSNIDEYNTRANPLEVTDTLTFVCPCAPDMEGFVNVRCENKSQDNKLHGTETAGYPFPFFFLCDRCQEVMRKREKMFFKITKIEELNPQQQLRRDKVINILDRRQWNRYKVPNNHPKQISKDEIATMLTVNDVFLVSLGQMVVFGIIPGNTLFNELCEHYYKLWKVSTVDGRKTIVQQIYDYIKERHGRFLIKKAGVLHEISEEDMTRGHGPPAGRIHQLLKNKSRKLTTDEIDAYHIENKHIFIDLSRLKKQKRRQQCEICEEQVVSGCNTCKKYVCRTHWDDFKQSSCSSR